MANKKVLLITYYWPPSGGAGVHRWLRFSRFFKENGIDLTVYCPEDAAWPALDEKLLNEVSSDLTIVRRPIFEPHKYLSKGGPGVGLTEQKKPGVLKKAIIWVRGNLFIPDSRAFWIKPSVRFLKKYISDQGGFDAIISTGPPHSTHLIALKLKQAFDVKWIADFRDPWTQIDFYDQLNIGARADKKQHELEKLVLKSADEIVTVSNSCAEGLEIIASRKVEVVTNGYTFPEFEIPNIDPSGAFKLTHFGSMPSSRNPKHLWQTLGELVATDQEFSNSFVLELVGTADHEVIQSISEAGLGEHVRFVNAVSHSESIALQRTTPLLLLIANNTGNVKGILTGKFFEYLGAKRPILATGVSDSDLQKAMQSTNAGFFSTGSNNDELKSFLLNAFEKFKVGALTSTTANTEQYSSRKLAGDFCRIVLRNFE